MNANKVNDSPSNLEKTKKDCAVSKTETLTFSDTMSKRALENMDKTVKNFKSCKVSDIVDLSDFSEI